MKRIVLFVKLTIVTSFVLSAQQPNQIKGKELFGDLKARHIGPALMSGRVTDIEGHPKNSQVVYIGTAGGGVWKSNDGGVIFNSVFDDYCQSIGVVRVDPSQPDRNVWVGTGEVWTRNSTSIGNGIYKSTDGGTNWVNMGLKNTERISSIEIHPSNSNIIYVGALGALWGDSEDRGVYKSIDGGNTWEKILYINPSTGCSDLIMDPVDPNTIYAAFWEFRRTPWSFNSGGNYSSLHKSTDGGKTWNKIHNGFPGGKLGRIGIAIAPSDNKRLYAVLETEKDKDKGLYRSDDAGASWKHVNGDFGLTVRPFYFSRLVVHPKDKNIVAKGGLYGSISRDGGETFKSPGAMHPDIHDIWFDFNDPDKVFFATDGGLYRSLNGGTTLEIIENLPVSQFYHISLDNQTPYKIYGGLQDNGSWFGPSNSPGGVEARDWETIGAGDGFRVYPHPTKPWIMYSEMQGAENIWRYDHQLRQIKIVKPFPVKGDPKLRFNWNAAITTSLHKPDRLYVGSQFLHRSDDMGETWVKISPDLTTNDPSKQQQENSGGLSADNSGAENHCTIFTIGESPLDENILWVGTDDGNVQLTQDGGKSWSNVTGNITGMPKNTWCYHIEPSKFSKSTAYVVFDGHTLNDMTPYVYKTTDFGKTWTSIATKEIETFARNIQEDIVNPDLLFLGTEMGLYVTIDGGVNWSKFTNNVPSVAIHFMDIHPTTNDLVMGTHGRGIIILDDISPLRELNPQVMNEELHFFNSKPVVLDEESTFGGTSSEVQFVGQNKTTDAQIIYYLNKRHTFGKMTLDIFDMEGNYINSLAPGKQKGINIVTWSCTMKSPKVAEGKTMAFGGFTSPRVPAGKYKVVINKGNKQFETIIELKYPENSVYTLDDRKMQKEVTLKLYNYSEKLAYMVYEMDEIIKHANESLLKNKSLDKVVKKLTGELNTLKETLVITKGDNYVGAAEPQLREKMLDLFSTVANYPGKPTDAQLQNLELLEQKFLEANERYNNIKVNEYSKYNQAIVKSGMTPLTIKSFEEFVDKRSN